GCLLEPAGLDAFRVTTDRLQIRGHARLLHVVPVAADLIVFETELAVEDRPILLVHLVLEVALAAGGRARADHPDRVLFPRVVDDVAALLAAQLAPLALIGALPATDDAVALFDHVEIAVHRVEVDAGPRLVLGHRTLGDLR